MDIEGAYKIYDKMVLIRMVEEAIIKEYPNQEIRTPVHLYLGQEAIAAAVSVHLNDKDFIVSNHRSHGHCLAKGLDLDGFFCELYGKVGGVTSGWGGSMHLSDLTKGIVGTSAIVAGGIPIGVGTALKQKIKKEPNLTVIYFGDGAVDEGVFWEAINISSLKKLPVLFVMENNRYASQTVDRLRHGYEDITSIIKSFGISTGKVDGNDALAIYQLSGEMIEQIRQGDGPGFMECVTFRMMGHVGVSDDTDTGYRTREEYNFWKEKCPIGIIEQHLLRENANAGEQMKKIKDKWRQKIAESIKKAKEAPYALD